VTGGGRGIGRGIALVLAGEGADLVLADIDLKNANTTASEIREMGRQAMVSRVDVTTGAPWSRASARRSTASGASTSS
jgi:meso-butanediol dehydrogenase/(S,S)-butanediol dehydrogenase/diacetyl reductase